MEEVTSQNTINQSFFVQIDRMVSFRLVLFAVLCLALGGASGADESNVIARDSTQKAEPAADSVEYPRPAGPLVPRVGEDEPEKSVSDVPGLTEDMVSEALKEARREVLDEDRREVRDMAMQTRGYTHQTAHYRNRYHPGLEPTRKRALIMERTMRKVADKLG